MGSGFRVVAMVTLTLLLMTGSAFAVGYDRYYGGERRGIHPQHTTQASVSLWDSVRDASMVEKFPGAIDHAAVVIKNILSQFGLVEKKAP